MRRADFHFDLPEALIAQRPAQCRSASRLLKVDVAQQVLTDLRFTDLLDWLRPGDLMIFNDTRVLPARLVGHKATGGAVEILLERILSGNEALVQLRASKSPKPGSPIVVEGGETLEVLGRVREFYRVGAPDIATIFDQYGSVPLPPYIERPPETDDLERYQTVFSRKPGAVAAPTAGLHFDQALIDAIDEKGVHRAFVTLHVGAGTFQPVRADQIEDHQMHSERFFVDESLAAAWRDAKAQGSRVIAVGTTTVRCLEASFANDAVVAGSGDTKIFIYPGREVASIDALLTNFHLPESTLIMMVAAIAGTDMTMRAYQHAVRERYRFFSYGDAMLIDREGVA